MRVLIIDDEEDTRSIASMSLTILGGLEVIEAENGQDGVNKAAAEQPDVILLDMAQVRLRRFVAMIVPAIFQ